MSGPFAYSVDHGVAILDWQTPGRSMNVLDAEGLQSLEAGVTKAAADDAVVGLVITSSREHFGGGMDLSLLAGIGTGSDAPRRAFELAWQFHQLHRKIETCGKPVVAAAPGTAVGGVYELMLACHRRLAADNPETRIGLPEVKVGLFPGGGGTTRLIRLLGLQAAGMLLLEGRVLRPQDAARSGLIDEVVPAAELRARAVEWARTAGSDAAVQPWDRPGYRMPGGAPYTPRGFPVFAGAAAIGQARGRGNYPAVDALLAAAYEGALVPFDSALRIEARWIAKVLCDPRAQAMMRTNFISKRALERGARRPAGVAVNELCRLGIVGAGMMGAGIAYVSAMAGMEVVLLDKDDAGVARGTAAVQRLLAGASKRGLVSEAEAGAVFQRVTAGTDLAALADRELVIEAVFEDPKVKAATLAGIAGVVGADTVIASNTSTLPISELAQAVSGRERFLGIHFFSPVERMSLVEVIRGKDTGDAAVGTALSLIAQIRKTPIVVQDARFFYANRCIIPYTVEAAGMVAEGINPVRIERAALAAGMPIGCLQLVDETSLELGHHILEATRAALGDAYQPTGGDEVFRRMVVEEGRLGRKSGAGFYDYQDGRRTRLWPGLAKLWPLLPEQPPLSELRDRLLAIQAVEAVRALQENVLEDVREGDVGAVLGWGFAPWSGGPFSWLDQIGGQSAVAMLTQLAEKFGPRFAPPKLLSELANDGTSFYAKYAGGT